jgi:hypothetical protein
VTVGQVVRDQQQHGQLAAACNLLSAAGAGPKAVLDESE